MIYIGVTIETDVQSGKVKISPYYSCKDENSNWQKLNKSSPLEFPFGNYKFLRQREQLVKINLSDKSHLTSAELLDNTKIIPVLEVPENYPPINFMRNIRKIENVDIKSGLEFLLKESDALYSSFRVVSEYSKMIKFELIDSYVKRIRLVDIENTISFFTIPSKSGISSHFLLKNDLRRFQVLLEDKGDIIYMEDPREVLDKYKILDEFNLTSKGSFNTMLNYYKLQTAEKKLKKDLDQFEVEKQAIEAEYKEKEKALEELKTQVTYMENNYDQRKEETAKELEILEDTYLQKKSEITTQIDSIEENYLEKKESLTRSIEELERQYNQDKEEKEKAIKELANEHIQKKEEMIGELRIFDNRSIQMKEQLEKLDKLKDEKQQEIEKLKEEQKYLMDLDKGLKEREKKLLDSIKKMESDQKLIELKENLVKKEMLALEMVKKERINLEKELKELKESKDSLCPEVEAIKKDLEATSKELSDKRWRLEQVRGQLKELSPEEVENLDGENVISILIVDDNKITRKLTTTILKKHNFAILEAGDGESGIQSANDNKPDIILMDLMLPDISGYEASEKLKEADDTADIPIIAFSALSDPTAILKAMKAGCCDYLAKPFKIEEFLQKISKFMPSEKLNTIKQKEEESD